LSTWKFGTPRGTTCKKPTRIKKAKSYGDEKSSCFGSKHNCYGGKKPGWGGKRLSMKENRTKGPVNRKSPAISLTPVND